LFGKTPETEDSLKDKASATRHDVQCTTCGGLLTLIKVSKRKGDYETTTYQCHNVKHGKMCLEVHTVTDSVPFYMRPGDFDSGDAGWQAAAPETVPAADLEGLATTEVFKPKPVFSGVPAKPEYPGTRATVNKIIWEFFWTSIMTKGKVDRDKMEKFVRQTATVSKPKIEAALSTVMTWIPERTGYEIKLVGGFYEVARKNARLGGKGLIGEPFSTPEYKKVHGF
jgi:hypothetical protein